MEQTQEGDDACNWRQAFDGLLVFEQDFDTAMQILMFQDEKVARLSLEDSTTARRKRAGRRAKSRSSSARSPSRKRRRTETTQSTRAEPPTPPFSSFTQSSDLWSSVESTAEAEDTTQASWMPSCSLLETQEDTSTQTSLSNGCCAVGGADGNDDESSGDARSESAAPTTAESNGGDGGRDERIESVGTSPTAVSSLFQTHAGKVTSTDNMMLEREHAAVVTTFEKHSSTQTLGVSTANVLNFKPPAADTIPTNGCTYCPNEGQHERKSANVHCWRDEASTMDKRKSGSTVRSLFQPASVRAVEISKARSVKYTEKMFEDVTTISTPTSSQRLYNHHDIKQRNEEESVVTSTASEVRDVPGVATGVDAAADRGATVPSLFQTGSGKAVSVSKARLQAYEVKLRSEEESVVASTASEVRDVHGVATGADAAADRGTTVPSLFQTGSGKAVSVSKARLQAYEAKLRSEEESVVASTASEVRDVHGVATGADAAADRGTTVPSLFQTGSGKAVSVSKARLQAYEAKLRSEEESVVASTASEVRDVHGVATGADAAADRGATVPSLFQTGSGKAVSVSKARLQAYEAKLRSEEESVVASTASEVRDVHGVATGADAAADRGATVPSLFQTGSGKAVSVSKARLQAYEAKLRSEEESVVVSTASEVCDVHGVATGADAAADRGATVPSLFQTGSGKAVSVSKARLQAYEAKLRSEEESVVASTASEVRDVHGVATGADAAADRGATVPSLFQTGSGKAVSVSKARLQAYEAKLRSEEESVVVSTASEVCDVHGVATGADAAADRGATVPSLFQTGSGKAVSVSKARLQAYEAKLRSEEESVVASTASEVRDVHGVATGADAAADRGATLPSLFQTGSGKAVSVSKARLQAYEAKLRSEEESVVVSTASEVCDVHGVATGADAAADRGATVPSLFQTGSGKAVSVSKARLQAYEAKLRSEEESVVASTASEVRDVHGVATGADAAADRGATVPSLFQTGSGKAVSVSKARLQAYEAKLRSEEESVVASTASEVRDVHGVATGADAAADRGATVPSLFQTGSGKAVSVSKARLQAYEAKLRSEEESVVVSTASEVCDVHGVATGADAAADRGATVPSLFQTGSGKAVSVSKARLQAYEAKLRSEEESVVASTASEVRDVHGVATGADAAADRGATVPSLFQTGSGKAVSVSKARLQAYEAKLRSEEESVVVSTASEVCDVHGVATGADAAADRGATVPSLFQTGSGKAVSVSKARLQAYEAKLRSEEESVVASTASEVRDVHGVATGADAAADRGATLPSLFQTGSGKAVSVSKARLQAYEAKLRSEEESVVVSTASEVCDVHGVATGADAAADRGATVPSLFQTGSGKAVSVSKARLQAYEAKLRSEEESVVASTASEVRDVHGVATGADAAADRGATLPSLFQTGSGKAVSVSKARLQAYEAKLRSEEESVVVSTASEVRDVHGVATGADAAADRGATVPSLFQTGSGKAVSVSKARLQAYEAKFRSEEESVVASTASEVRDVHGVATGADAAADRGATVPSLFQTGSGKAVSVSKARLQAYEAKFRSEEESVVASTASEVRDVHGVATGADAAADRGATVPSLFQTGSGKAVSVSKARLQAYEAKLRSEEESVVVSTASEVRDVHGVATGADAAADRGTTVPSLFQTGSGKAVSVSKARLQAYEAKLRSEEESVVASTASEVRDVHGVATGADAAADRGATVPSLFQTGSGKAVSVSKARLQAYEAKLRSEEESVVASTASEVRDVHGVATGADAAADRGATVPSLFQTGSGKAVSVSKARLQAYEAKLRSEEESVVASTASEVRDVQGVGGDFKEVGERVGLRELDEAKVLRTSQNSRGMHNRRVSASKDPERDYWGNGVSALSNRSFHRRHSMIDGQSRHDHGLSCGDKENVHPENVLVRKTAALEASKSWQSGPRSTQLNSAVLAKYPQHQLTRRALVAKRSIKSSTTPSRARVSGKKRFQPPVASKKTLGIDAPGLNNVRYQAVPTTKKQKVISSEPQPFIYNEAMKISFRVLVGLHEDRTLPAAGWELPQFEALFSITAESSVHVGFSRDGDLVRLSDCSYDSVLFTGPRELYSQLKAGGHILETSGATFAWFLNHYRWVVWKLAATERSFSRVLLKKYLTREQVMKQITHRYRQELNNSQRPILKKVLQRDASSLNCMVLCIAAVLPFHADNNTSVDQELPACWNMSLVLTDGWYSVYAVPDAPLAAVLWKLHAKSSLVGTKIATWNAALQNSTEGIDPLECAIVRDLQWKNPLMAKEDVTQWPYLQLRYNSTRRVRFDTRLGVEKLHYTLPTNSRGRKQQPQLTFSMLKSVPLKSLEVGGGMVRSVRIRVTRISPVLHLQAKEWTLGPRILCEEQLPIYFQLRSEYGRASMRKKIQQSGVESGSSDWVDDDQFDVPPPIPFIKVDVECTHTSTNDQGVGCGILTIWRPSEELLSGGLREGAEYFASSLTVNWKVDGGRGQDAFLRLSSTKYTNFEEVKDEETLCDSDAKGATQLTRNQRVCVDVQQATTEYRTNFESERRNERRPTIDVCVCVVMVTAREMQDDSSIAIKRQAEFSLLDPAIKPKGSRYVDHVFVTDQSRHLMSIRVSGMEVNMPKKKTSPLKRGSSSSFAFRRGNKNVWKEGAVFCLSGLEVSHYDEQLRVLDCVLVESTQIVSFPSKKSPFWESFQYLQREARISSARRSAPDPTSSDFPAEAAQLKKYVEREILRMDFVASQECDQHHVEVVEQERLTQDLQAHEEGGCDTSEQANESLGMQNRHLRWDGTVVKVLPLLGPNKHIFPCDVIALVCVNITADDNAFRTVYLSRGVAISMRSLLQGTDAEKQLRLKENEATEDGDAIVQSITELLAAAKLCKADNTFQFEVRQVTNERLINSWKPWERLHASYWVANTVTHVPK